VKKSATKGPPWVKILPKSTGKYFVPHKPVINRSTPQHINTNTLTQVINNDAGSNTVGGIDFFSVLLPGFISPFFSLHNSTSTHQHIITVISISTYHHISTSTQCHHSINTSTHQYINYTSTQSSTHCTNPVITPALFNTSTVIHEQSITYSGKAPIRLFVIQREVGKNASFS
jgi:hypothetical protein